MYILYMYNTCIIINVLYMYYTRPCNCIACPASLYPISVRSEALLGRLTGQSRHCLTCMRLVVCLWNCARFILWAHINSMCAQEIFHPQKFREIKVFEVNQFNVSNDTSLNPLGFCSHFCGFCIQKSYKLVKIKCYFSEPSTWATS